MKNIFVGFFLMMLSFSLLANSVYTSNGHDELFCATTKVDGGTQKYGFIGTAEAGFYTVHFLDPAGNITKREKFQRTSDGTVTVSYDVIEGNCSKVAMK